jgi:acyl carrier protein
LRRSFFYSLSLVRLLLLGMGARYRRLFTHYFNSVHSDMQRLVGILVKVLDIDPAQVTDDLSPEMVATWDSFNGLMLVSELESVFGIKFTTSEITAVKNVADIKAALTRHGVVLHSS